ncbi:MAG: hypothetical protein ABI358_05825 [Ginsengibacter sp.]
MKTILVILVFTSLSLGVSAQRKGGFHHARSSVIIVPSFSYGFGYGYPVFGNPMFGSPYGYPYGYNPYYGARRMPYKLSLQIESIKVDYRNQIRNARNDKGLSHAQKRQEIRNLKAQRDQDIINAQRNYRPSGRMNNQNNGTNYQNPNNGS